jgi:hypothetical protein
MDRVSDAFPSVVTAAPCGLQRQLFVPEILFNRFLCCGSREKLIRLSGGLNCFPLLCLLGLSCLRIQGAIFLFLPDTFHVFMR